nr:MAG TPA_asm: hypothetical protein [Caudoviricetes sp.]
MDRLEPLLKDSWLKYSQLDTFIRLTGAEDAFRYIELYQKQRLNVARCAMSASENGSIINVGQKASVNNR